MKRFFSLSLALVMLLSLFALTGCTSSSQNVDLKTVLTEINEEFSDSTSDLTELDDVSELDKYYSIDSDLVKQFAAEITSDTSKAPVEIVLVEANSSDDVEQIETCLNDRYQAIYSQYASYSAEQFDMVKNCAVTVNGNFVFLIVSQDYDDILALVNESFG